MALPRKKSRTIVVKGETWYWRTSKGIRMDEASKLRFAESQKRAIEKNPELKGKRFLMMFGSGDLQYVKTMSLVATRKSEQPFMIKAEFLDCERLLPKVVSAVIAYANQHAGSGDRLLEIEDASRLFEQALVGSEEKEAGIGRLRNEQYRMNRSAGFEREADDYILEGKFFDAIRPLRNAIMYDKTNPHKLRKLDHLIRDDHASAALFNQRAFSYYYLYKYDAAPGYLEKAYRDALQAIALDSDYAIAYGTLAEIQYAMGDTEGFYDNLETALQKGMTQVIDGDIGFAVKEQVRYLALLERFGKQGWIKAYW